MAALFWLRRTSSIVPFHCALTGVSSANPVCGLGAGDGLTKDEGKRQKEDAMQNSDLVYLCYFILVYPYFLPPCYVL